MNVKNFPGIRSLLLENRSLKQTLLKNTFWLGLSEGVGRIFRAVLFIYIARILGATDYGKFSFALAVASLFVSFFDMGLSGIITRELARDKKREEDFFALFSLRILLGFGTLAVVFVCSFFITEDQYIRKVIWILATFSFISLFPEIFYAFLRARQRMEYESWANMIQIVFVTSCGMFVLFYCPSVLNISLSYLFSSIAAVTIVFCFFHFRILPLRLSLDVSVWKRFLAMSWPLALTSIFSMIYGFTDSIIMGYLGQITQTGWYNAALKIVMVTFAPAAIISLNFFPILSQSARKSQARLQKVWNYQLGIMIFMAIPIIVGGISTAPRLIEFFYGSDYSASVPVFQILIFMVGTYAFSVTCSQVLIATNHQGKTFWVAVIGAIINTVLNLILIPKYSLYGAAYSAVISNVLMVVIYFAFAFRFASVHPFNTEILFFLIGALLSSLSMIFVISQPFMETLNILFVILIGTLVYCTILLTGQKILQRLNIYTFGQA
ncbi:MAG: flippase [Deltaproteobacteria bacterium]|nr:flippase [Deltaproteobacteria bacterium]